MFRKNLQTGRVRGWNLLFLSSILTSLALRSAGLPASFLIGSMSCAVAVSVSGHALRVPSALYTVSLGFIGVMISSAISPASFASAASNWPVVLATVAGMVAFSLLLGWVLSGSKLLPGTTGIWGSAPGAATAMVILSEDHGADPRLVAVMQYARVMVVAFAASIIARIFLHTSAPAAKPMWIPPDWTAFAVTSVIAAAAAFAGVLLRLPSSRLLLPLCAGAAFRLLTNLPLEIPPIVLAASLTILGWHIGLTFTRETVRHALRILPVVLASILVLVAFCLILALVLSESLGIDFLTAYLATNPGGLDTAAVIAASTSADMSFILFLQTIRFTSVLVIGPAAARWMAQRRMRNS